MWPLSSLLPALTRQLDAFALRELLAKREAIARLRTKFEVSEARACSIIQADRTLAR
jgi:hypothetical protein